MRHVQYFKPMAVVITRLKQNKCKTGCGCHATVDGWNTDYFMLTDTEALYFFSFFFFKSLLSIEGNCTVGTESVLLCGFISRYDPFHIKYNNFNQFYYKKKSISAVVYVMMMLGKSQGIAKANTILVFL